MLSRSRRSPATATALVAVALLGAACSSDKMDVAPPTIPAAAPAAAPAPVESPAGTVRPLPGPAQAAVFDATTATLVVLRPGAKPDAPAELAVLGADGGTRIVTLPGPATAIAGGEPSFAGTVYLSRRGGYLTVDVADGTIAEVEVQGQTGTDFTAVARRADGRVVLGSADGAVFILREPAGAMAEVEYRVGIFARVDALVTQGNTTVVLDRGQTSVTSVAPDGKAQQALRAGEGATTMVADPAGRVLVADTRGDELLVFTADPLIMRQRYPVPSAPYGLAGSTQLSWVSQTAANTVIGYDLATGIPVEKVRYPTVQQPNIVSYDATSDTLYVVSDSGAGVQVLPHATSPR